MSVNRDKVTILFSLCRKLQMQVIIGLFNYITSSVSELEKLNPALLLATRAGLKGILYSGLATVSHSPTRKWCFIHSYCAVLCCAVLCCAVLCCAVLCCAVLCCAVLCCAVLCCAVLCCAVLCCAVLCCAVLCCAVLCCAVLCCAVLCCAVLCCAVLCFAQTVY